MHNGANNGFPPGNRQTRFYPSIEAQNSNEWNHWHPMETRAFPFRQMDVRVIPPTYRRLLEERLRAGPPAFTRRLPPLRIAILDNETVPEVNPWQRQVVQQSPPRIMDQYHMQFPPQQEEQSRLTQEEQKKALNKLKPQVYSPKGTSRKRCLYYRDSFKGKQETKHEDGQRCPICWEDFVANEPLQVTPCNHMFHYDCIVPWVKSHGQCPVCRFLLCDQRRETSAFPLNNNMITADPIAIFRAMGEGLEFMNRARLHT